jgi:hypothetical protein
MALATYSERLVVGWAGFLRAAVDDTALSMPEFIHLSAFWITCVFFRLPTLIDRLVGLSAGLLRLC